MGRYPVGQEGAAKCLPTHPSFFQPAPTYLLDKHQWASETTSEGLWYMGEIPPTLFLGHCPVQLLCLLFYHQWVWHDSQAALPTVACPALFPDWETTTEPSISPGCATATRPSAVPRMCSHLQAPYVVLECTTTAAETGIVPWCHWHHPGVSAFSELVQRTQLYFWWDLNPPWVF